MTLSEPALTSATRNPGWNETGDYGDDGGRDQTSEKSLLAERHAIEPWQLQSWQQWSHREEEPRDDEPEAAAHGRQRHALGEAVTNES